MSDVIDSVKLSEHSKMKGYMELELNDPTNHRIYSWVNEEYFYKGLERAKAEKLFVNDVGRIDLYKLIQFLWGTFADGNYVALPNHSCRKAVVEYITKITSDEKKVEAVAEMILDVKPKRKSRAKPKEDETNKVIA